jgi:HD-GYP domain-containing protein (c-di-GMP phosphodiesterase class II)
VVDAYGSMMSDRPYRSAMSEEEAVEELRRCSGSQFDPKIVDKFIDIVKPTEAENALQEQS